MKAPSQILFRWLCQLKIGSYSYDCKAALKGCFFRLLSQYPRIKAHNNYCLVLENLAPGQRVMGIFKLVEIEPNRHLTIVMDDKQAISIFGEIAASYVVLPITQNTCRLILKGLIRYPLK